ncbi:hypothetical protein [Ureibacillus manganicus]|uniref:Uncharacterized protein n=1 Tax=Ureibacillus manganicus DSM 26584 TaxID=1384049 RepID=A0A0A3I4V7_9BACL|nr:hypothetical protein [Ureibacillus manganicus]KGR79811.1 hypothetical protein CD29_04565 [Ureibacillus manganicus DSM 26584]
MSNQQMNNSGMNYANSKIGGSCKLERTSQVNRNLKHNNVEFAEEFNPNGQIGRPAPLARREFEPNEQQTPVSERTAWN